MPPLGQIASTLGYGQITTNAHTTNPYLSSSGTFYQQPYSDSISFSFDTASNYSATYYKNLNYSISGTVLKDAQKLKMRYRAKRGWMEKHHLLKKKKVEPLKDLQGDVVHIFTQTTEDAYEIQNNFMTYLREIAAKRFEEMLPPVMVAQFMEPPVVQEWGSELDLSEQSTITAERKVKVLPKDIEVNGPLYYDTDKDFEFYEMSLRIQNEFLVDMTLADKEIEFFAKKELKKRVQSFIRKNLNVSKEVKRTPLPKIPLTEKQAAEVKARETLRDMITESEWRRYLTNGFVMVKGKSGLFYQIFSTHSKRINVFHNNEHIESICIHTDQECPPSDHVINMKVLIELDEEAVRKGGNISKVYSQNQQENNRIRLQTGILNSLQEHANNGVIAQTFVDEARGRIQNRNATKLEQLRGTSENLASFYKKLKTA